MIRDIENIDDDIIRKKRIIGKMLYSDPDIIEVIDSHDLDPNCPDEYLYRHIYPYIRIPDTQDVSKTFITFMLDNMDISKYNPSMANQYLKVVIFVHKDLVQTPWGADRHDILGYLVRDIFHLSNVLGNQLNLVSDREGVTDTDYCTRTLQFEIITPNSMKPYKTNPYEFKSIVGRRDGVLQREPVR